MLVYSKSSRWRLQRRTGCSLEKFLLVLDVTWPGQHARTISVRATGRPVPRTDLRLSQYKRREQRLICRSPTKATFRGIGVQGSDP